MNPQRLLVGAWLKQLGSDGKGA
jgi:hypothetical protein